tara:strand:+ start:385 stop:1800 length:1416 start_codon:yes stop_codon:yes gene_type:complete
MIGKAIYKLLKNEVSDLATGGIYPVIMPQNPNDSNNFPAVIYTTSIETMDSKDAEINMFKATVEIQVVAESYDSANNISRKIKYIFDHYVDRKTKQYSDPIFIEGFKTKDGYSHNYVSNINIDNVFFQDNDDDYFDELYLYSITNLYDIYFYNNINKFSFDKGGLISNPLTVSLDATQVTSENKSGLISALTTGQVSLGNGGNPRVWLNTNGNFEGKETASSDVSEFNRFLSIGSPKYYNDTTFAHMRFGQAVADSFHLSDLSGNLKTLSIEYGALFILVYRPITVGQNILLGDFDIDAGYTNSSLYLTHTKNGSDITIKFNPRGFFDNFSSETETLITTTDSANYWDADLHFIALSVGGNKANTGGSKNQKGWFEYFNSTYNPKLTTGQIINDNSFSGNTNTYNKSCTFASVGGWANGTGSSGINIHELLIFVPEGKTKRIDVDSAPFQPTDIIYNEAKNYIFSKYKNLK